MNNYLSVIAVLSVVSLIAVGFAVHCWHLKKKAQEKDRNILNRLLEYLAPNTPIAIIAIGFDKIAKDLKDPEWALEVLTSCYHKRLLAAENIPDVLRILRRFVDSHPTSSALWKNACNASRKTIREKIEGIIEESTKQGLYESVHKFRNTPPIAWVLSDDGPIETVLTEAEEARYL